ncbi:MAG: putative HTH-type transcriptional regulator [Firmicutes bacterium ADurb.Bin099]|jgi:DNA-binding LytR/AlgR family response regulator|nr:MAG: putative HTH-type transcriptional regulator [Firmicutes bacterium ADurb.Bin099]HPL08985.1 LytTR family DNA-binding domain-containing protein [Clostridia bacterium]HPY97814.1 LytTR family DNA-binding domain-containing protein [Clostridia bacterium]HQC67943.1 LytTR family DNA-binding domain-containing protein [Clostridia bacterium]
MQIEIKIDEDCKEPKIIVVTDKMTEEINEVIKKLSEQQPQIIAGFKEEIVKVLELSDIYRIYASGGKVFAETTHGEYMLRLRLYEIEERLDNNNFVRISNSDIINLKKVKGFDLSLAGTICVILSNGTVTYVSRRFVARIKQLLGI